MKKQVDHNELDTSHIIADIFQLNMELITAYDKYPKWIGYRLEKNKRKKLINMARNIGNANIPLTTESIYEFMGNIYNNYSKFVGDDKIFEGVTDISVTTVDKYDIWQMLISNKENEISCNIKIDMMERNIMELEIFYTTSDGSISSYNLKGEKLYTRKNKKLKEYIEIINSTILKLMADYTVYVLETYNERSK